MAVVSLVMAILTWGVLGVRATGAAAAPVVPGGSAIHPAVAAHGHRITATLRVQGTVRTYHLYVPNGLPKGPVPLLVALHGGLGSGVQFEQNTDFDGLAQANHFLVVYPDGTPTALGPTHLVWNAGGCCGLAQASRENVDDVGFIEALVSHLEARYHVDRSRVFVTGHSNGALLAFALVCADARGIDAIAVQAGALLVSPCHPAEPVSALEIHGTDDQNIPINGGKGARDVSGTTFPPPVDALETVAAADGCTATPVTSGDPVNRAVTVESWSGCDDRTSVEWLKVAGANHAWMGHPGTPGSAVLVGQPYMGFDSSAAVWSFLAAHPRRAA